ncbi:CMP-N,N'-diacetyllegionaminic acid synthase [compost metagenome]
MKKIINCLTIIPARGGSKGIPMKNTKLLNGIPLINYTIEAALNSVSKGFVLVSTDNQLIANVAKDAGALVPFTRPAELATDNASSIDVLIHALSHYETNNSCIVENVILLQPTSPLRNAQDIDNAWKIYIDKKADSLQSVCEVDDHPGYMRVIKEGILHPYIDSFKPENFCRQDLTGLYKLNGAIYILKRDLAMKEKKITGRKNVAYIMPKERSIDIDNSIDFKLVELLMQNNN